MNRLGDTSAFVIPAGQLLLTRRGKTRMYTVGIVFEFYTVPFNRAWFQIVVLDMHCALIFDSPFQHEKTYRTATTSHSESSTLHPATCPHKCIQIIFLPKHHQTMEQPAIINSTTIPQLRQALQSTPTSGIARRGATHLTY